MRLPAARCIQWAICRSGCGADPNVFATNAYAYLGSVNKSRVFNRQLLVLKSYFYLNDKNVLKSDADLVQQLISPEDE